MAFPAGRSNVAASLSEGDQVLIYTTRGCFRNSTRDEGRIMTRAKVTSPVRDLSEPIQFGERRFTAGCDLHIEALAPYRQGLVLRDLVSRLDVFPDPAAWGIRLRRAALVLPPQDAQLINRELDPHLKPYDDAVEGYRTL
nr:hypothetical protein [Streptomyces sp. SID8499]